MIGSISHAMIVSTATLAARRASGAPVEIQIDAASTKNTDDAMAGVGQENQPEIDPAQRVQQQHDRQAGHGAREHPTRQAASLPSTISALHSRVASKKSSVRRSFSAAMLNAPADKARKTMVA